MRPDQNKPCIPHLICTEFEIQRQDTEVWPCIGMKMYAQSSWRTSADHDPGSREAIKVSVLHGMFNEMLKWMKQASFHNTFQLTRQVYFLYVIIFNPLKPCWV